MVWLVREAAPLHDLGKIAIPDSILLKPGRLSDEEYEVVKTHALLGARVLAGGGVRAARGGRADRPPPPRALGRRRLPGRPGRRRDPGRGADRCTSPTCSTCSCTSARTRTPGPSRRRRRRSARGAGTQFDPAVVRGVRRARPGRLAARGAAAVGSDLRGGGTIGGPRRRELRWSPQRPPGCSSSPTAPPPRRRCSRPSASAPAGARARSRCWSRTRRTACTASSTPRIRARTRPRTTLELALPLLEKAAGAPVEGIDRRPGAAGRDPGRGQPARLRRADHLDAADARLALAAARPAAQGGRARAAGDHRDRRRPRGRGGLR